MPETVPVFPQPRTVRELDVDPPPAGVAPRILEDSSIARQGYRLRYAADGFLLAAPDSAGTRYGLDTLDQLRASGSGAVEIEDWPDFERRGYMLDISRDRVPTRASLRRLVDVLAAVRINQLELYLEHTFAYRDHAEVWEDASPLTPADIRWLDALCAGRGIELVPNQNTFGHWERWLAHDENRARAEVQEPISIAGIERPPSTLAPTPENAAFVTGVVDELAANFRSRRINIGADETWELGRGASRERVERDGLGVVYVEYLLEVMGPWLDRGYTVEFWADILAHHPEAAHRIPASTEPIVWWYEAPSISRRLVAAMPEARRRELEAHGTNLDELQGGFAARAKPLIDRGVPFSVAPGTCSWQSIIGRLDNALGNLLDTAEVGAKHGSTLYLMTTWGDRGMYEPPVVSYPPLVYGAAVSWGFEANRDIDLADVLDRVVFDDASGALSRSLVAVGRVADELGSIAFNSSPLFTALIGAGRLEPYEQPDEEHLRGAADTLAAALAALETATPAIGRGRDELAELAQAIRLAAFAVDLLADGMLARDPEPGDAPRASALLTRLDALIEGQRSAWLRSSRPGGLDDSLARLRPLRRALQRRSVA